MRLRRTVSVAGAPNADSPLPDLKATRASAGSALSHGTFSDRQGSLIDRDAAGPLGRTAKNTFERNVNPRPSVNRIAQWFAGIGVSP